MIELPNVSLQVTSCLSANPRESVLQLAAAKATDPVRIDLACGRNVRAGFHGVDLYAPDCEKVDLLKFPWPWANDSVDELHCSHFVEHVPARDIDERDLRCGSDDVKGPFMGRDMLCAFMDEAWRVLKDKALFTVIVPCARSNRAFMDPTHRRFFVAESFLYFHKPWRDVNRLGICECDFELQVDPIVPTEMTLLHPEAAARRFNESWNVVLDWQARLQCVKNRGATDGAKGPARA